MSARYVIAIANQKGGVGKTTSAVNLAASLAIRGYATLLVDFDSQCNATQSYLPAEMIKTTLADVLLGHQNRAPLIDAIYHTHIVNLDLAPSHIRLALLERTVQIEEQYRLKDSIDSVADYQFIIIDCPPSLGMMLTQALLASTHVLVPIAAQYYPLEGVIDLTNTIQAARRANPNLAILGYVATCFDVRNKICGEALVKIQQMFAEQVFETVIRSNVKLQTAPVFRQTIYEHAPDSHGSTDYYALTDEIIERLKIKHKHLKAVKNDRIEKAQ